MTTSATKLEIRPLPAWAWFLATATFPAGVFVALGAARALRWPWAVGWAVLSYGVACLFVAGMITAEQYHGDQLSLFVLLGMLFYLTAAGQLQYAAGLRAGIWSDRATKAWRLLGYAAVVSAALICVGLTIRLLLPGITMRLV